MLDQKTIHIAIFASGRGSNAKVIIQHFSHHKYISVKLLCTNNPHSGVWRLGTDHGIAVELLERNQYTDGQYLQNLMTRYEIDLIVLAGYLKKVPNLFIGAFPKRIINIHPSLLPAFGGKGMYGLNVHRAVIAAKRSTSGITIHYVNEEYDKGEIIFQKSIKIASSIKPETLRDEILKLEHKHYPLVVEKVCQAIHS